VHDAAAAAGELAIRYALLPLLLLHVSRVFQRSSCGRRVHCSSFRDGTGHKSWSKCMMQQLHLASWPSGMRFSCYVGRMIAVCSREAASADVCIACRFVTAQGTRLGASVDAAAGELAIRYVLFLLRVLYVSCVYQRSSSGRCVHCCSFCESRKRRCYGGSKVGVLSPRQRMAAVVC
jgi:hypothetical protein